MIIAKSTRAGKRFMATFANGKVVHFGSAGGRTYIDHGDEAKRRAYIARHSKNNENWTNPYTAGHNEDKRWATYLGNRNCGKGVEYDLLKAAFGDYISTFELGNLLYCRKTAGMENVDCSKKLYWLMDLEFVRLAVSQEIPDTKSGLTVNGKQLKKITGGGDEIVARRNYDRFDTHFFTDFTPYIQGNYTLSCDSPDCEQTLFEFFSTVEYISQHEYDKKPVN